jgi:dipeptide/tripeptide permease
MPSLVFCPKLARPLGTVGALVIDTVLGTETTVATGAVVVVAPERTVIPERTAAGEFDVLLVVGGFQIQGVLDAIGILLLLFLLSFDL